MNSTTTTTRTARSTLASALCALALFNPSVAAAQDASAQETLPWEDYDRLQISLLAGLTQPLLLSGGNAQVDLYYKRFVFDWSHGFNLQFDGDTVVGEAAEQQLSFRMPYTTGFGVGVRLLEWLDVRFEGKLHRFEVREASASDPSFSYNTATLGAGVYARYRPFYHFGLAAKMPQWTHGFVIAPSVRYWPNVWSSLEDDELVYDNASTGARETHSALRAGLANTPLVANIGLGYMITF
ncbi:MAG: hypothetical protein AAGI01_08335 [Myxococcota bacterium]